MKYVRGHFFADFSTLTGFKRKFTFFFSLKLLNCTEKNLTYFLISTSRDFNEILKTQTNTCVLFLQHN